MKQSTYHTYDELPLFLNAETAAALLGVSSSSMYELMRERGYYYDLYTRQYEDLVWQS